MAVRAVKVTVRKQAGGQIAEIFTVGVMAWTWLLQAGIVDEVKSRLRLERKDGCTGVDLFGMLVLLWLSRAVGQRALQEKAKACTKALATVIGSSRWYGQTSMSRSLASATPQQSREFGDYLLGTALPVGALDRDECAFHRDTFGERWRLIDTDGRVHAIRQRALPEGEDLPEAVRRAEDIAGPGYPGRKRGEVQFHQMTLQDAGTGRLLGVRTGPGNGDHHAEMKWAAERTGWWADQLEFARDHMVMRFDGKSSGAPSLLACESAGIGFLTRWTDYKLLESPEVIRRMLCGPWREVPDSGSGPRREAMEQGRQLLLCRSEQQEGEELSVETREYRIVVSRYRLNEKEKHGSGKLIDGYVYEMYATSLPVDAWPAAEVVELYYGRAVEECRFSQVDQELGYDHVLSWHPPGQELASAVGLFTWNLRLVWGSELANWRPMELPPQLPREPEPRSAQESPLVQPTAQEAENNDTSSAVLPRSAPCAEAADPCCAEVRTEESTTPLVKNAIADGKPVEVVAEQPPDIKSIPEHPCHDRAVDRLVQVSLLTTLVWSSLLQCMPGWRWNEDEQTLYCPTSEPMIFHACRPQSPCTQRVYFRMRRRISCQACQRHAECTSSTNREFRKEVSFTIPGNVAINPPKRGDHQTTTRRKSPVPSSSPTWSPRPPDLSRPAGPYEPIAPALIPSVLRHAPAEILGTCRVTVAAPTRQSQNRQVAWLASSKIERQHRRRSWTQRYDRALIPDSQPLTLHIEFPSDATQAHRRAVAKTVLSVCAKRANG